MSPARSTDWHWLKCPACDASFEADARFCPRCGLPLVPPEPDEPVSPPTASQLQARKIKPQLAEGKLVKVAWASNQAEGEFIQGLLLEEGVPSLLRRSAGFDVPDFLAAGPRDVLVPQSGAQTAREVLLQSEIAQPEAAARVAPARLLAGLLIALILGVLVLWLVSRLVG